MTFSVKSADQQAVDAARVVYAPLIDKAMAAARDIFEVCGQWGAVEAATPESHHDDDLLDYYAEATGWSLLTRIRLGGVVQVIEETTASCAATPERLSTLEANAAQFLESCGRQPSTREHDVVRCRRLEVVDDDGWAWAVIGVFDADASDGGEQVDGERGVLVRSADCDRQAYLGLTLGSPSVDLTRGGNVVASLAAGRTFVHLSMLDADAQGGFEAKVDRAGVVTVTQNGSEQ